MKMTNLEEIMELRLFKEFGILLDQRSTPSDFLTAVELGGTSPEYIFMKDRHMSSVPLLFTRITIGKDVGVEYSVLTKIGAAPRKPDSIIRVKSYLCECVAVYLSPIAEQPNKFAIFNSYPILKVALYPNGSFKLMHAKEFENYEEYQKSRYTIADHCAFHSYQDSTAQMRMLDGMKLKADDAVDLIISFIYKNT